MAERSRPSEAVARTQTAARRAGGAWNRHDTAALRANLGAAREAGLPRLMLEYGGLRFRYDLQHQDGAVTTHVDGDRMDDAPAGAPGPATSTGGGATSESQSERVAQRNQERQLRVAQTATERNRRQKAARKERDAAAREHAAVYVTQPYGSDAAPAVDVSCDLWSTKLDLKMAFTKAVGEVTHRFATKARQADGSSTKATSLRFGNIMYQVTVLSGTVALQLGTDALSTDLVVLLAKGLTEERLATLLTRWAKPRRTQDVVWTFS